MARIGKSERRGIIVLVVLALLLIGGAWLVRRCDRAGSYSMPEVKIIQDAQSAGSSDDSNSSGDSDRNRNSRKGNTKNKSRKRKSTGKKSASKRHDSKLSDETYPYRDILADTITTRTRPR